MRKAKSWASLVPVNSDGPGLASALPLIPPPWLRLPLSLSLSLSPPLSPVSCKSSEAPMAAAMAAASSSPAYAAACPPAIACMHVVDETMK